MLMTMVIMAISMVMIDNNDVDNKFDHGESDGGDEGVNCNQIAH